MVTRPGSAEDSLWYKDAIIYELHVRAFKDSNGDGIGDFPGLIQKMDYLQDLGVTCLWVLPFFPSPLKDDGYDISQFLRVERYRGKIQRRSNYLLGHGKVQLDLGSCGQTVLLAPVFLTSARSEL